MSVVRMADGLALLLFASVYLGTGVTLTFFLFPIAPQLTPDTYRVPFVGPVQAATRFFTYMTVLMLIGGVGLVLLELGSLLWIGPALYLVLTLASTLLTTQRIIPINKRMAAGIHNAAELQTTLARWRSLNTIRASLWACQWTAMAIWVAARLDT